MRPLYQYLLSLLLALCDQGVVRFVYDHARGSIHWQHHVWFGTVSNEAGLLVAIILFVAVLNLVPRSLGTTLVAAGILSNGFSYLLYRGIPDYLLIPGFYTNLADMLIIGGCVLVGIEIMTEPKKTR